MQENSQICVIAFWKSALDGPGWSVLSRGSDLHKPSRLPAHPPTTPTPHVKVDKVPVTAEVDICSGANEHKTSTDVKPSQKERKRESEKKKRRKNNNNNNNNGKKTQNKDLLSN